MALVQSTETRMVLHDPKGIKLGSGKALTGDQYNFIKKQQRSTQNFWDSKWAFPTGDIHERESFVRALDFVCWGMYNCTVGDCCSQLHAGRYGGDRGLRMRPRSLTFTHI